MILLSTLTAIGRLDVIEVKQLRLGQSRHPCRPTDRLACLAARLIAHFAAVGLNDLAELHQLADSTKQVDLQRCCHTQSVWVALQTLAQSAIVLEPVTPQ